MAIPESGLPRLLFSVFLLVLLLNTFAASPDRVRVLRSMLVIFGSAFVLKFIVLAALSDPEGGWLKRVLVAMLEGLTLGTLSQDLYRPATGYVAFVTLALFVGALALLPPRRGGLQPWQDDPISRRASTKLPISAPQPILARRALL